MYLTRSQPRVSITITKAPAARHKSSCSSSRYDPAVTKAPAARRVTIQQPGQVAAALLVPIDRSRCLNAAWVSIPASQLSPLPLFDDTVLESDSTDRLKTAGQARAGQHGAAYQMMRHPAHSRNLYTQPPQHHTQEIACLLDSLAVVVLRKCERVFVMTTEWESGFGPKSISANRPHIRTLLF